MNEKETKLYTDGSSTGRVGEGGWAWVAIVGPVGGKKEYYCNSGGGYKETNQTMELMAAIKGLEWIRDHNPQDRLRIFGSIILVSDSTYVLGIACRKFYTKKNI